MTDFEPEPEDAVEPDVEVDAEPNEPEETTLESGLDESPEQTDDALISPMQMEAKNVLDTLGAGFDDLPDEPPDWMDSTAAAPPSVYRELSDLTHSAEEKIGNADLEENLEPEPDETTDLEENLEPEPDETTDLEENLEPFDTDTAETEPIEPEPDLDEAVASALSAIETPDEDLEPFDTDTAETEPIEPEPDLDEAVASALSAIETPDEDLEPFDTDTAETEPIEPEPDLDEAVASALSAIETPDEDLEPFDTDTAETEPIEPEPDLDEAVASALSAIETPDEDLEPFDTDTAETEPIEPEPDLDEAVASAVSAVEPGEPGASGTQTEPGLIESPSVAWGSNWGSAAQGWIRQDGGRSTWRPIVTTTSGVGAWEVDTFLGIVAGDATIAEAGNLAGARKAALQTLVDEALSRGAHAVVGVRTAVHEVGRSVIFSATGTAVTLRNPS